MAPAVPRRNNVQVETPKVGAAKATTHMAGASQTRPCLASHSLDLPNHCDICNKPRSTRKHQRCSQIRQQRKSVEWEAYMANVEAKRRQRGSRLARQEPSQLGTAVTPGAKA